MAPHNEIENGAVEKETQHAQARDGLGNTGDEPELDQGEYGNLVKYISNYKDGRRGSSAAGSTYDDMPPKKKWYQFGKKGDGMGGAAGFDTPEDWLLTDWKRGLTTHDVENRRKKTGWNELTTEKENMFLKFLSYFTGPILYGTFT
jgi:H+-transporting ATPase